MMEENNRDEFKNASGCADPTAYQAIRNADEEYARFYRLLKTIFSICNIAGFRLEGRITLVDQRTGRIWR